MRERLRSMSIEELESLAEAYVKSMKIIETYRAEHPAETLELDEYQFQCSNYLIQIFQEIKTREKLSKIS